LFEEEMGGNCEREEERKKERKKERKIERKKERKKDYINQEKRKIPL